MDQIIYTLPGGYVDEAGVVHRSVELVPLSGRQEEFLADSENPASAVSVTTILSDCIQRIGTISPVSREIIRSLLVADRQYLLLKLREVTFGHRVQVTISCPWQDCNKRIDIDFSIQDIPVIESDNKGPTHKMKLSPEAAFIGDDGKRYREVIFRLPNGGDQEIISPLVYENETEASAMLLERCVQSIGPLKCPRNKLISRLSPIGRMEIERQMEMVAPRVELTMEGDCPECGREFEVPFDLQSFLFGELRLSKDLLYREVHYLAYHYHWSERDIMDMPRDKRRKYIEILADEIERLNNAV